MLGAVVICFCPRHLPCSLNEVAPRIARAQSQLLAEREENQRRAYLSDCVITAERAVEDRRRDLFSARSRGRGVTESRRRYEAARTVLVRYRESLRALGEMA